MCMYMYVRTCLVIGRHKIVDLEVDTVVCIRYDAKLSWYVVQHEMDDVWHVVGSDNVGVRPGSQHRAAAYGHVHGCATNTSLWQ